MLRADHLSFAYRAGSARVIDDVSVSVAKGDLIGILGPNGSGKTTLLKMLSGTLAASAGTIAFEGRALGEWTRRDLARRIALVPQETHAPFDYTVLDIVLMGRYPHLGTFALEGPDDLAIARRALASTATSEFEQRPFATLSGGEKQRVVIASALAQSPELLLLDEPTASLDLGHQLDVQILLADLNRNQGVTMVLSTHDLNFAAALCRQLILLHNGHVVAAGPTEEVLTPKTIRVLYGVDADVHRHPAGRHLTVTPLARVR